MRYHCQKRFSPLIGECCCTRLDCSSFATTVVVSAVSRMPSGSTGACVSATGSVRKRWRTGSSGLLEFSSQDSAAVALAGFGDTVDVESPLTLHARLAAIGHRLVARYGQDDG